MSDWRRRAGPDASPASSHGVHTAKGVPTARGRRVAIVASEFNDAIVAQLIEGALGAWHKHNGDPEKLRLLRVPGAFELPVVALRLARSKECDAIVALGCVIRGDTPHFDYVAGECARGLQQVACETGVPVGFGVVTVNTTQQAEERASLTGGNKGQEAMEVALEVADLIAKL